MSFKTSLNAKHREAGAKLVDFAGWEMPLYYGSQIAEHNRVRQDAGMFDVSHMTIVDCKGKEAYEYLLYLFANNIDKLKNIGDALYSCMLNERAGVVDDLIVYKLNDSDYRVVVNAATHDKDMAWFKQHIGKFNVKIIERTNLAMLAIQGPNARAKAAQAFTAEQLEAVKNLKAFQGVAVGEWWIARTGYTGEDGYEIMLPAFEAPMFWQELLDCGIAPCGLVARDSLRLEAGLSLYGAEMDENVTPLEANLAWTIAWEPQDRDFIGRIALETQKKDGVKRILVGLALEDKGILRSRQKVIVPNLGEGETTSGGFAPTLGYAVALARVPQGTKIGDVCQVIIRDKPLQARVVKLPFVKNGKKTV
jgi:aminomethyltransferase